jgi:hypothetical protein
MSELWKSVIEILYIAFLAFVGEFILGWLIKFATGNFLWVYPGSILVTASVFALPIWILGIAALKIIVRFTKEVYTKRIMRAHDPGGSPQ